MFTRPKALSHIFGPKAYEYPKPGFAARVLGENASSVSEMH